MKTQESGEMARDVEIQRRSGELAVNLFLHVL